MNQDYWVIFNNTKMLYVTDRNGNIVYYPSETLAQKHLYNINVSVTKPESQDDYKVCYV